jgi:hypothetical protein
LVFGDFGGLKLLRSVRGRLRGFIGSQSNAKLVTGDSQLVVGQKCGTADALPVDARAVRAAEVAQEEQAVGLHDDAVHLRNRLVSQAYITLIASPYERQILGDSDWSRAIEGNQLGTHGKDGIGERTAGGRGNIPRTIR